MYTFSDPLNTRLRKKPELQLEIVSCSMYIYLFTRKSHTHPPGEESKAESLMLLVPICLVGLVASGMLVVNTDFM